MKTDIPKTVSMGSRQGLSDQPSLNGKRNTEKSKVVPVGLTEVNGAPLSKLLSFAAQRYTACGIGGISCSQKPSIVQTFRNLLV